MSVIDYYTMSDGQLLKELGERLRDLRLQRDITQQELAERVLLSTGTIQSLEKGQGKLSSLVVVLRELGALDQLDQFIPSVKLSPLQAAEARVRESTHKRERASRRPDTDKPPKQTEQTGQTRKRSS